MSKFKESINGYQKSEVKELLKILQAEHLLKKNTLENELKGILAEIQKLK
jgi:cell division septum initiation protein DivIVA